MDPQTEYDKVLLPPGAVWNCRLLKSGRSSVQHRLQEHSILVSSAWINQAVIALQECRKRVEGRGKLRLTFNKEQTVSFHVRNLIVNVFLLNYSTCSHIPNLSPR